MLQILPVYKPGDIVKVRCNIYGISKRWYGREAVVLESLDPSPGYAYLGWYNVRVLIDGICIIFINSALKIVKTAIETRAEMAKRN